MTPEDAIKMASLRIDRDIPGLVKALSSEDSMMAMMAAETLGDLRALIALEPLLHAAEPGREPYRQYAAAEALGKLGDQRAVPHLIQLVESGDYGADAATEALGRLGDIAAVEPLRRRLIGDRMADRETAANALAALGAFDELSKFAASRARWAMPLAQWPAACALAQHSDVRSAAPLARLANGPEEYVIALEVIGRLKAHGQLSFVLARLRDDDDSVRYAAAEALAELVDPASLMPLARALTDSYPPAQQAAARAIVRLHGSDAILDRLQHGASVNERIGYCYAAALASAPYHQYNLARLVREDPSKTVRVEAATALAKAADPALARSLLPVLLQRLANEDDADFCVESVEILGILRLDEARSQLVNALSAARAKVRASAARSLGLIGGAESIPALLEALNDAAVPVVANALEALGRMKDPRALHAIIDLAISSSGDLQERAVNALTQFGPSLTEEAYVKLLTSSAADAVRVTAAEQLGKSRSGRSWAALQRALDDSSPTVAAAALTALIKLRDVRSVSILEKVLENPRIAMEFAGQAIPALAEIGGQAATRILAQTYASNTFYGNASLHFLSRDALKSLGR
jgi:HEAT repeat protein